MRLKKNNNFSFGILNERLFEMGFDRVDFVSSPGEFAVRGGIMEEEPSSLMFVTTNAKIRTAFV